MTHYDRAMAHVTEGNSDARTAACVIYAADDPPVELLDALLARRVDVRVERDPYAVIAALQESKPRRGQAPVPMVLVLAEPDRLALLGRVLDVVSIVVPGVTLWRHAAGDPQPLAAVTPDERRSYRSGYSGGATSGFSDAGEGFVPAQGALRAVETPSLRLAGGESGEMPNPNRSSSDTDGADVDAQKSVSEPELEVLLGLRASSERCHEQ